MTTIQHEIHAKCAAGRVWQLLSDLEAVARYNPTVRAASVTGTPRSGIGAIRACEREPKGRVMKRKLTSTLDAVFEELVKQAEGA